MRWLNLALVGCWAVLPISCGGVGLAHEERLVDDLGLVAADTQEQMAVKDFRPGSGGHLVPASVFAVGWDQSHIIAKRHPMEDFRIDKTRTEYFIVVVRERKAYGPFDEPGYRKQREALGVADELQFTRVFRNLE